MYKMIELGIYQSSGYKGSVGRVSVLVLQLRGWCRWGVARCLTRRWKGGMALYMCKL